MKTDARLQRDVTAELHWEPAVHAAQIGVEVRQGVVTLTGEVGSLGEKWHAEQAAQRVVGVRALAVELKIRLDPLCQPTDADIANSAKNILDWTSALPAEAVKVMVEGGWLTLSGEVEWQYQRQAAGNSLRYLAGVSGLSNQIAIKPAVTAGLVKSDIEAALRRRTTTNGRSIDVAIADGEVTLTGTVRSWAEHDLATNSAWGTAGVRSVVDKMTLSI
jgi:osmotically-inducible protein OsmY